MEDLAKLTQEEEEILMLTEEIWNRFLALPINHPMEANHPMETQLMASLALVHD